jgi:WD40 repeat protein
MSNAPSLTTEREKRLCDVLARYLDALEAGETPDREQLLIDHPDLAHELRQFFTNADGLAVPAEPNNTAAFSDNNSRTAPSAGAAAPECRRRFGNYEILHEIARGGMGVVYRARQVSLNREVALKMILGGPGAGLETLRRFRIEAEAAAHLDHPNIVPIYEVGEIDGQAYFTMKLVEGGCLAGRLNEFRLPLPSEGAGPDRQGAAPKGARLADLLAAVSRAVHHAHQRGILHRDLKPANILLDRQGQPHVADFGLAKRVEQDSGLTQSQTIVGTAAYMAPEQARPSKEGLTIAADVYSLGAILYELLTGRPPFVGESFIDTLLKAAEEPPVPPRRCNPNVPGDLEAICLKCLAKKPGQRYGSAQDLAEDLERWRAGDVISLWTPTTAERFWHWAQRNRLVATLLATVAGLMAAVTIGSLVAAWFIAAARTQADDNARKADENARHATELADKESQARATAEEALARNRRLLVSGYVTNGTYALDGGDPLGALVWYGEALRLDRGDPDREEPHRVRLATVLRRCPKLVQVWFDNDPAAPPALSPDGRRVILLQKDTARVWDVATGEAVSPPLKHAAELKRATFSPDGKRIVTVAANGTARVWDSSTGKALTPNLKHETALNWAAFSPDGRKLATVGADRMARVWDAATGKPLTDPLRHEYPVLFASFSHDGKRLVTCGGQSEGPRGEVRVWELGGSKPMARVLQRSTVIHWACLTQDAEHVVAVGGRRIAHLWSLATPAKTDGPSAAIVRLDPDGAVGPDPTHVLKLEGSTAQVYDLSQGKPIGPPLVHGGEMFLAVFSPDGRLVATSARDRTTRIWDAATGNPLTPPLHHGRLVRRAAFSADGRWLLTTTDDGVVRVWEVASRELVQALPRPNATGPTALSPDGRLVAVADTNGALWVRDAVSDKVLHGPWKLPAAAIALRFAPDSRRLLAASEAGARIWDAITGEPYTPVMAHAGAVQQLVFTPDGSRAGIVGARDLLEVYDAASGAVRSSQTVPAKDSPGGLALTPDGQGIVVLDKTRQNVEVLDLAGALRTGPFRHLGLVTAAAFSPDGSRLAVATADGQAFLWDSSAHPAAAPLQHGSPLHSIAFSGDGRRLVTVADDHTARVWDVATGQPVTPLLAHAEPIVWAGLAADGHRLATRCKSGSGYVWDLAPDTRPVQDLVRLTQLLAGQAVDGQSGGFEPLEPSRLRDVWPQLRATYPQEFTPTAP